MPEVTSQTIEQRTATSPQTMSLDLTHHMANRLAAGRIVVVAERPSILLAVVRKRWIKYIHDVERQRCCTLNRERKQALNAQIDRMQTAHFSTQVTQGKDQPDVCFVDSQTLVDSVYYLRKFSSVYITSDLKEKDLSALMNATAKDTTFVLYEGRLPSSQELKVEPQNSTETLKAA